LIFSFENGILFLTCLKKEGGIVNKKLIFVSFAAIALVLGACFSPWKGDEGTFSVSIGGGDSRTAWNDPEILAGLKHTITLSDGPGPDQTRPNVKYGSTVHFAVTPGSWLISITALLNGEPYAWASQPVDIKPGQNGDITIKMTPITSGGTEEPPEAGEPYIFTIKLNDEEINLPGIPDDPIPISFNDPLTITLIGDYTSYQWYIDGILLPGNFFEGLQYTLNPPETLKIYDLPPGIHRVTVVVVKNGVPYSKIVTFTVEG